MGQEKAAYLDSIQQLVDWCENNVLELNASTTKKWRIDLRKEKLMCPRQKSGDRLPQREVNVSTTKIWR